MADDPTRCGLTLICPLAVEENLLDLLLEQAGNNVFTRTPAFSHGTAQGKLTATEHALGRSRALQVSRLRSADDLSDLRSRLQRELAGSGLRYWALPLALDEGLS